MPPFDAKIKPNQWDLVEGVPSKIKEAVSKADGDEIVKKLTEAGASAELK